MEQAIEIDLNCNKYILQKNRLEAKSELQHSVTVITPTTGTLQLVDAIESVQSQNFPDIVHLIVVDGLEYEKNVLSILKRCKSKKTKLLVLPFNTGKNGYNGHRIYAAVSFLINSEYVLFLDEDNWFDENHVRTLIEKIIAEDLDWAYSMRKIYSYEKLFIAQDNCESIGPYKPFSQRPFLIDTNCYALRLQTLIKVAHFWYHPFGADRYFYYMLQKLFPNYLGTKLFTVNYRLSNIKGLSSQFFEYGNAFMEAKYDKNFPWMR